MNRKHSPILPLSSFVLAGLLATCGSGEVGGSGETARNQEEASGEIPSQSTAAILELEATYPEGFSFLNGVRELPDGTILVADPLAQALLRIDLDASSADSLGRVGPGPQEYQQPDQVLPLPNNRSLLVDLGKMQLTEMAPDGSFEGGRSMSIPREEGFPMVLHPRFVDDQGLLYDQAPRTREGGPPDSAAVIRFDRSTGAVDTVATVWIPEPQMTRTRGRGFLPRLLEAADAWGIGPEGEVVIVRARDFSPEWIHPDGRIVTGPPIPFTEFPVTRADKISILEEVRNSAISSTAAVSRDGGVQRMTMSRGIPDTGDSPGVDDFEWAETFPPFRTDGVVISPEGEVWVQRYLPAAEGTRWEVVDGEARWVGTVALPGQYRLLGFGQGTDGREVAYLTRTDDYGLKWLERHRVLR